MRDTWNDPQPPGRVVTAEHDIEFRSIIPGSLRTADVPALLAAARCERVLFCDPRDGKDPAAAQLARRFRDVSRSDKTPSVIDRPDQPLTAELLLDGMRTK